MNWGQDFGPPRLIRRPLGPVRGKLETSTAEVAPDDFWNCSSKVERLM